MDDPIADGAHESRYHCWQDGQSPPGRGGIATGGAATAARTMGMLGTILEYARTSLKIIKENPARGVKKPPDRKQRRFLKERWGRSARPYVKPK